MKKIASIFSLCAVVSSHASAQNNFVIVIPPDLSGDTTSLKRNIMQAFLSVPIGANFHIYEAGTNKSLTRIFIPNEDIFKSHQLRLQQFGAGLSPTFSQFSQSKAAQTPLVNNIHIPGTLRMISNLLTTLPGKKADVLLLGSLNFADSRENINTSDGYVPSDQHLRVNELESIFGVKNRQTSLTSVQVHFCGQDKSFTTAIHEEQLARFWHLYVEGQAGTVGTYSTDLSTCFNRFLSSQPRTAQQYALDAADVRLEMRKIQRSVSKPTLPLSPAPGATLETARPAFLSPDVSISREMPTINRGRLRIGISWQQPVDLDLYVRGSPSSHFLYFGRKSTAEGRFNKDLTSSTAGSFEYIEFDNADWRTIDAVINFYHGTLSQSPSGIVRIEFDGKVYEQNFRFNQVALKGNGGAGSASGSLVGVGWHKIDVRSIIDSIVAGR